MAAFVEPRTYRLTMEGIANNFMNYPHFRVFIETDSDSSTVLMSINHVTDAGKVDFESAMGGRRRDDSHQPRKNRGNRYHRRATQTVG